MRKSPLTPEQLKILDLRIQGMTKYDGDCEVWTGAPRKSGLPPQVGFRFDGERSMLSARTIRWNAQRGVPLGHNYVVRMTCGNPLCLTAAHMVRKTRAELVRRNAEESGTRRTIATMIANRKVRGKLDEDKAHEIRTSGEIDRVLAQRFGVSRALIGQVRRGERWPDPTMAQLRRSL